MADTPASPSDGGGNHDSVSPRASSYNDIREQDRFLPIANISRIMKKAIPVDGKIDKDAKEAMQELVSEFIALITYEESEKYKREKRETMTGDDLLWAMKTLGFEDYVESLKVYLNKYLSREVLTDAVDVWVK